MLIHYNKPCLFYGFCLILLEQVFYLLPIKIGSLYLQDIALVLIMLRVCGYLLSRRGLFQVKTVFEKLSISFVTLIIIAAVMAYLNWNQTLLQSILPNRQLLIIALCIFSLKIDIANNKVNIKQLESMLLTIGKIEIIIMMAQFVAQFAGIYFLTCNYNNTLYTFTRFAIDGTLIIFLFFYELSNIFTGSRNKIASIFWCMLCVVFYFMMVQTRMVILGICFALIVLYLTMKISLRRKIIVTMLFAVIAVLIWNTSIFQDTINIENSGRNTMTIRTEAMAFYVSEVSESPIVGLGGYPNSEAANADRNLESRYYLNDNGLFAILYMYGIIGIIWVIIMYSNMLIKGKRAISILGNNVYIMLAVYYIAMSATIIHWYWVRSAFLLTVIVWAILDSAIEEQENSILMWEKGEI